MEWSMDTEQPGTRTRYTYTIHYFRYGQQLAGWNMWIWYEYQEGRSYAFQAVDGEGFAVATIELPVPRIEIITRWSTQDNDWADQEMVRGVVVPEGDHEVHVWLVQDDKTVYYDPAKADVSPKFRSVLADASDTLIAVTSEYIMNEDVETIRLIDVAAQKTIPVSAVRTGDCELTIKLANTEPLDVTSVYMLGSRHFSAAKITMRRILDQPEFLYKGQALGVTYTAGESLFKVWAPTAAKVSLLLYEDAGAYSTEGMVTDHNDMRSKVPMERASCGVWSAVVSGNLAGQCYMYLLEFADGTSHTAIDPYARAVTANGQRAVVIDLAASNPPGWTSMKRPVLRQPPDAVIYELHVRDFSVDEDSGLVHKGKFKAFTELGTLTSDGLKSGVEHLGELGVTHVQLLPCSDYATVNELPAAGGNGARQEYNWGYDPQNYNVPEGSYALDPCDPVSRIREFKELVQALHDQGIGVVLDVVYNHTFSTDDGPFDRIVPGYYYRTTNTGRYTNASGVGNELASERPMVRKYILDSVRYWAEEFCIDGFRFDLMGLIDIDTMDEVTRMLRGMNPHILIYGEPWDMAGTTLPQEKKTLKGSQRSRGFGVFNDHLRIAIKGDSDGAHPGFATGAPGREGDIAAGVKGSIDTFTDSPAETINYVTAHDNYILWDKVIAARGLSHDRGMLDMRDGALHGGGSIEAAVNQAEPYKGLGEGTAVLHHELVRRTILANAIILTSQGIPMLHAGDEMLRTKYGDHNSYKSPDVINKIRWRNKMRFSHVFAYYKGLIKLRRTHPAFRMSTREAVTAHLQILRAEGNVVSFLIDGHACEDTWNRIVVIYNANEEAHDVSLPPNSGNWHIVVNDTAAGTSVLEQVEGTVGRVRVPLISVMVMYDTEN
ncbi:type I pullulanase [Paenibacillus sp. YPG26]|uniref:type I pullulanase n=1 Tax=Paenibacillus sp. YPG26 TaxID=2878915 RepID=UPI002040CFC2|nr:type I pullulanase [Paenibacillus sp. YPG26]USB33669.1 type I pullulanase [Paenibacillus sp. YPG26]